MSSPSQIPVQPRGPWIMAMRWHQLLFAHWRVPVEILRPKIPTGLELDLYGGEAWIAVVPFRMSGVRPRGLPAVPGPGAFPELNLRTYVRHGGIGGVWFFSLDAADWLAVRMARRFFHLPYFDARMVSRKGGGGWIDYLSERVHSGAKLSRFAARYRPVGEVFRSEPGSLEEFLTERYALFTVDGRGRILRGDIDHQPWPLQRAEWQPSRCDMTRLIDWQLPDEAPHLLYAEDLAVRAWWPRVVG